MSLQQKLKNKHKDAASQYISLYSIKKDNNVNNKSAVLNSSTLKK